MRAARDLAPRRGLTGETLPAIFPAAGAALAAGAINPAHARVIGKAIDAIPAEVDQAALGRGQRLTEQVEATLVAHAARLDPRQLAHVATRLLALLDPDGAAPREEEAERRRRLHLHTRADGTALLRGELTAETGAVWTTILDALSRPAPETGQLPDPRTAGQRRHDALLDAGQRLLRAGTLPDAGGTPVTLLITLTAEQLATRPGTRRTGHGALLPAGTAIRMADTGRAHRCLLDSHGGDHSTTAPPPAGQHRPTPRAGRPRPRLHLPRLHHPPSWSETHHVTPWLRRRTHRPGQPHPALRTPPPQLRTTGWTCQMTDGMPHWTPPAWLDPDQTPRVNTAQHHHLLDPAELLPTGTAPP